MSLVAKIRLALWAFCAVVVVGWVLLFLVVWEDQGFGTALWVAGLLPLTAGAFAAYCWLPDAEDEGGEGEEGDHPVWFWGPPH